MRRAVVIRDARTTWLYVGQGPVTVERFAAVLDDLERDLLRQVLEDAA